MGWKVRGSTPVGVKFSRPFQTDIEAHPAFSTVGTGSRSRDKMVGRDANHPATSSPGVKYG